MLQMLRQFRRVSVRLGGLPSLCLSSARWASALYAWVLRQTPIWRWYTDLVWFDQLFRGSGGDGFPVNDSIDIYCGFPLS